MFNLKSWMALGVLAYLPAIAMAGKITGVVETEEGERLGSVRFRLPLIDGNKKSVGERIIRSDADGAFTFELPDKSRLTEAFALDANCEVEWLEKPETWEGDIKIRIVAIPLLNTPGFDALPRATQEQTRSILADAVKVLSRFDEIHEYPDMADLERLLQHVWLRRDICAPILVDLLKDPSIAWPSSFLLARIMNDSERTQALAIPISDGPEFTTERVRANLLGGLTNPDSDEEWKLLKDGLTSDLEYVPRAAALALAANGSERAKLLLKENGHDYGDIAALTSLNGLRDADKHLFRLAEKLAEGEKSTVSEVSSVEHESRIERLATLTADTYDDVTWYRLRYRKHESGWRLIGIWEEFAISVFR